MSPLSLRLVLGCLLPGLLISAGISIPPAHGQPSRLSEQSQISLITILPGDPVYTFAGHSALRVRDPVQNLDRLYNYGTFNFNDPLFIPKFTYGYLRYSLSVSSTSPMFRFYKRVGRPVIEQPLRLSRSQRTEVFQFLQWNARPENRHYQYDFFFDNCSTRIRDVIKNTLGDNVDFSAVPAPNRTFREMLDPYVASRPALDLGFDLALGLPADRRPTDWEVMFLPNQLLRAFEHASVSVNGDQRPLVAHTDTIQRVSDYRAMEADFDWPFVLSIGFLLLIIGWTGWQAVSGSCTTSRIDAILLAISGSVGLGICYLWFISTYTVTDNNVNLAWAWPTHLYGAYLLLRHPSARSLRLYLTAATAATCLVALGWPLWPQNLHHAVLPLVVGVGIRMGWWTLVLRGTVPVGTSPPTAHSTSI